MINWRKYGNYDTNAIATQYRGPNFHPGMSSKGKTLVALPPQLYKPGSIDHMHMWVMKANMLLTGKEEDISRSKVEAHYKIAKMHKGFMKLHFERDEDLMKLQDALFGK